MTIKIEWGTQAGAYLEAHEREAIESEREGIGSGASVRVGRGEIAKYEDGTLVLIPADDPQSPKILGRVLDVKAAPERAIAPAWTVEGS